MCRLLNVNTVAIGVNDNFPVVSWFICIDILTKTLVFILIQNTLHQPTSYCQEYIENHIFVYRKWHSQRMSSQARGNDETACVPVTAGPPLEVKSMVMLSLSGVKVTGARKVVKTWQILQNWVSLILERLKHFRSCFLICASFPKTSSRDMLSHLQ